MPGAMPGMLPGGMLPGQQPTGPVLLPPPPPVVPPPLPGQAKMSPADRFVAQQMVVLQQYHQLMMEQQALLNKQKEAKAKGKGGAAPAGDAPAADAAAGGTGDPGMMGMQQPAYIGPDPHTLGAGGRSRKKTRDEIQQDMFLRKRSRKNIRAPAANSFDIDGLPFEDESDDSGDEGFFMPRNKCELIFLFL